MDQLNPYAPATSLAKDRCSRPTTSKTEAEANANWAVAIPWLVGAISLATSTAMNQLDFEAQKPVLLCFGAFVIAVAVAFPFLRLRHGLGLLVVLPFSLYIFGKFCGDVGRVHFAESIPLALGGELLLLMAILRLCYVGVKSVVRQFDS